MHQYLCKLLHIYFGPGTFVGCICLIQGIIQISPFALCTDLVNVEEWVLILLYYMPAFTYTAISNHVFTFIQIVCILCKFTVNNCVNCVLHQQYVNWTLYIFILINGTILYSNVLPFYITHSIGSTVFWNVLAVIAFMYHTLFCNK